MLKDKYYKMIESPEMLDYGVYLQCDTLLQCQKPLNTLATEDELQFQIVHQVEELWMKLICFSLANIMEAMSTQHHHKVITLFSRVHKLQNMMIQQLDILETMSPKDYQAIRTQLGNGSGQESPGFRTLLKMPDDIWDCFEQHYLEDGKYSVSDIYDQHYNHDHKYAVAEAMIEFDQLLQSFRWRHLLLIHRSIGISSASLKGRPVEMLRQGASKQYFPALWEIRSTMTDKWGEQYGKVRPSISADSNE